MNKFKAEDNFDWLSNNNSVHMHVINFKSDTLNVGKKLTEEKAEIVEAFLYAFDNGLEAAPTCELTSDSVHCYHGLKVEGKAIVIYTGFLKKDIVRSMN